jgi:SAM-dependent methyltransferase
MADGAHSQIANRWHGGCDAVNQGVFSSPDASHAHSLATLNVLYEYDDFMSSISIMADLGCGRGLDLEWWATRMTRDEHPRPLNIRCVGIDREPELSMARRYPNIQYQSQDFETALLRQNQRFDVLWCHDAFQYVMNPFQTLSIWRDSLNKDGMLVLILPQSTNIEHRTQAFDQRNYCYFNWTLVSLIHVLAVSGFDCRGGFFLKNPQDPWLHAVVYRSEIEPRDPRSTSWYELSDLGLLPESACVGIQSHGYLRQRDLTLPWLDRGLRSYANH